MTWKELKEQVESQGVTDDTDIIIMNVDFKDIVLPHIDTIEIGDSMVLIFT